MKHKSRYIVLIQKQELIQGINFRGITYAILALNREIKFYEI